MEVKIPFYNFLNMFLTGLLFIGITTLLYCDAITKFIERKSFGDINSWLGMLLVICIVAIAYEVGLIINRMGSIILEPLLKKLALIPFDDDYVKFSVHSKAYPIMDVLSREYALSRTRIVLFVILTFLSLFSHTKIFAIPFLLIAVLYFYSCKKHARKIVSIMNSNAE